MPICVSYFYRLLIFCTCKWLITFVLKSLLYSSGLSNIYQYVFTVEMLFLKLDYFRRVLKSLITLQSLQRSLNEDTFEWIEFITGWGLNYNFDEDFYTMKMIVNIMSLIYVNLMFLLLFSFFFSGSNVSNEIGCQWATCIFRLPKVELNDYLQARTCWHG